MQKIIFRSPSLYVQGQGVLDELGYYLNNLGTKALVMADDFVWGITKETVTASLEKSGFPYIHVAFNGEASDLEIKRIAALAEGADIVVGLGGGKTVDTAKAVADELKAAIAVVPTTASTDAPTSALSVIYSEDGTFENYKFYNKNPDLVLVDTGVIVKAPARLFASGMADAMATNLEAQATLRVNGDAMAGGKPSIAAMAIAEAAEKTLFTYGIAAYEAAKKGLVTPQVEAVVEANTLLSGLGFENGGLAGAHAIHNGFTALHGKLHELTHGEKVAYGSLVQLVLEGRSTEDIQKYIAFFQAIDMPTTLEGLHLESASEEDLLKVGALASNATETMKNLRATIGAEDVAAAIRMVDALSGK